MSKNFAVPQRSRAEELKLLNVFGMPDAGEVVTAENTFGTPFELKAFWLREAGDEYHSRTELSQSQFTKFLREPEIFHDRILADTIDAEESADFKFGKEVEHFLFHDELPGNPVVVPNELLSKRARPDKWFDDQQIERDPNNPDHFVFAKSGKPYAEFVAANPGRNILTQKEFDELSGPLNLIRQKIREHDKALPLLYGDSLRHIAIVFTCPFSGIELRCQIDILSGRCCIVDYKTAASNNPWQYAYKFDEFFYHIQATWYREAVRQLTGVTMPVIHVVTEKKSKSYIVEVFNIDDGWFERGLAEWRVGIANFQSCVESASWHRPTHNTIVNLKPPANLVRRSS